MFFRCSCDLWYLDRIRRSPWMRWLFPSHRLYLCVRCGAKSLVRKPARAAVGAGEPVPV